MSDMIERVARALYDAFDKTGEYVGDYNTDPYRDGKLYTTLNGKFCLAEIARAAIEAMREPTGAMLSAPLHEADGCDAQYQTDADFAAAWAAMIEAALKQP